MKSGKIHIDDDLLIRHLAGETTEGENLVVEAWLHESETHRQRLAGFRLLFERSKTLSAGTSGDPEQSWNQFKQRLDQRENTTGYPFKRWLSIAAAILIVVSVGVWLMLKPARVSFYTNEQPLTDSLPDGSLVSLNSHSSLIFHTGNVREVALKGEAFFEVKHDAKHPFRIRVNDVQIQVLGTSFNVKTIGDQTEVMVRAGLVSVSRGDQFIRLQNGEQLLTTPGTHWQKQTQRSFDINQYPGLIHAILKNPNRWPELLKDAGYKPSTKDLAIVDAIKHQLIRDGIMADGMVKTFRLDDSQFIVNGIAQPADVFGRFKAKYLTPHLEFIYLGHEHPKGKGITVNPDQN